MESNSKNNKNLVRINRHRYFQVSIHGLEGEGLVPLLTLESDLYALEIKYGESKICLENFHGQLEKDLLGLLYWNIVIETNRVITKRLLGKNLSRVLFGKKNEVDKRIKVYSLVKFVKLFRGRMWRVDLGKFFPGFLSRKYAEYKELSKSEEVKEAREHTILEDESRQSLI